VGVVALALADAAGAAPPAVIAQATPAHGIAPLTVTLTAAGDPATYVWQLGDGGTATGPVVTHVYRPGRWVATVIATNELGETAQAEVVVQAAPRTLTLTAPRVAGLGSGARLTGRLQPAVRGARIQIYRGRTYVTTAVAGAAGRYRTTVRIASPGPYRARYRDVTSAPRTILVRPRLVTSIPVAVALGRFGAARATLVPRHAGTVRIRVLAGRRVVGEARRGGAAAVRIPSAQARTLRVVVETRPRPGFTTARRTLTTRVVLPSLGRGARGPSVLALERRLRELRYALRGADSVYGHDTVEAVLAFQKVHRLTRTGRVDGAFWRQLAAASVPRPRRGGGDHVEIDKTRNVLYEIVGGRVNRIVHVSTGATGNTPVGTFHVYRKVGGWDWVLWYPLYFLRGFAIHGYPSVPAYPASHGCVRVPMWIAPSIFSHYGYGTRIVVYT
jgi:hypothetical protein